VTAALPNMRMQRTRRLASLGRSLRSLGSPLMRKPLGDLKSRFRWACLIVEATAAACALAACASGAAQFQNLVVWNQANTPERISITVDGSDVYSGILGTIDSAPQIVRTQQMAWPVGQHTIVVTVPGRGITRSAVFVVRDKPVNLHVMVNRDEVQVNVTYGPEAYL